MVLVGMGLRLLLLVLRLPIGLSATLPFEEDRVALVACVAYNFVLGFVVNLLLMWSLDCQGT
jgi:hypothetical protein